MCVRVFWGEQRVTSHVLRGGQAVAEGALVFSSAPARVFFREGTVGELHGEGKGPQSLADLVAQGRAVDAGEGWWLELGRSDVVRVFAGPLTLEAARLAPPRRVPFSFEPDYDFLNVLVVCLAVFGGMAMRAELLADEGESDEPTVSMTHFARALVHATPPPPKQKDLAPEPTPTPSQKKQAVARAEAGTPAPARTRRAREAGVGRLPSTLVSDLFSGPGLGAVAGAGGLGKALEGALGNVTAANGTGLGGLRLKGDGLGGGGGPRADIGSIGMSNARSYAGGALCAEGKKCKDSPGPTLAFPEVPTCESGTASCLDRELIRKIIHQHVGQIRACYELALQRAPSTSGKVTVAFLVNAAGMVAASDVRTNDTGSAELGDCLARRARTWQFPVDKSGTGFRVTYPFLFKPAN